MSESNIVFDSKLSFFYRADHPLCSQVDGDHFGSDEEEQEDPKDYVKGKSTFHFSQLF